MKSFKIIFSIFFVLFLLFSCKEKPKNPVAEYGNALVDSYKRGQQAGEKANLEALKQAVASYRATNGRLPENLEEAQEFIGSGIDMSKYDYNPDNGMVSLKK
jgi:hypothetical protein